MKLFPINKIDEINIKSKVLINFPSFCLTFSCTARWNKFWPLQRAEDEIICRVVEQIGVCLPLTESGSALQGAVNGLGSVAATASGYATTWLGAVLIARGAQPWPQRAERALDVAPRWPSIWHLTHRTINKILSLRRVRVPASISALMHSIFLSLTQTNARAARWRKMASFNALTAIFRCVLYITISHKDIYLMHYHNF